jgi:hypothetical protein
MLEVLEDDFYPRFRQELATVHHHEHDHHRVHPALASELLLKGLELLDAVHHGLGRRLWRLLHGFDLGHETVDDGVLRILLHAGFSLLARVEDEDRR